jgi:hypothetical protein
MSAPVAYTIPARLYSLPDDVLRALATFVPLSDLLVLVRCSRHFLFVLRWLLNACLDRLYVVTHLEEHWDRVPGGQFSEIPKQPEQRVMIILFGRADKRDDFRMYCFVEVDGKSVLRVIRKKYADFYTKYYIFGANKSARDRFASWLQYRCAQQLATETHAYDNTTEEFSGGNSDL